MSDISQETFTRVADAIVRAFFSRPLEDQHISVTSQDQEDLARAAIEAFNVKVDLRAPVLRGSR